MKLFPALRVLAKAAKNLDRCATALERLADVYAPKGLTKPLPLEPLTVQEEVDYARVDRAAAKLAKELGREPEPDEILRVMAQDLLEEEDAPEDLQRRRSGEPVVPYTP